MKAYTIFVCEKCGKESKDREVIMKCEASHYGLTVAELHEWKQLQECVRYTSSVVYRTKNEQTERDYDCAIASLLEFEKAHNLKE
jgi:predicted metal-binding protein